MKEEKKHIYIMLAHTGTIFTRLIQQYTKAPYNHVSLAFDEHLNELYSFGRKQAYNALNGGFVCEDVQCGVYSHFPKTLCVIYRYEVDEVSYKKLKRMMRFFEQHKNAYYYNYLGLIGVLLKRPIEIKGTYFCSQFVAEMLDRIGCNLWGKHPALMTPDDFRHTKEFQLVYEGKLYEYPPIVIKNKKKVKN